MLGCLARLKEPCVDALFFYVIKSFIGMHVT